jgi:hypothetical protein
MWAKDRQEEKAYVGPVSPLAKDWDRPRAIPEKTDSGDICSTRPHMSAERQKR